MSETTLRQITRQITRFTCDLCSRVEDATVLHRPHGWRIVYVRLDGRRLMHPCTEREPYGITVACSNTCIAQFVTLYEPELTSAWNDKDKFPLRDAPPRDTCESCRREREGAGGWRWLNVQFCSEYGSEACFGGWEATVCSLECGVALLRACAKDVLDKDIDRATEDREFANPHPTVGKE